MVDLNGRALHLDPGLAAVRDWVVDLARDDLAVAMRAHQREAEEQDIPPAVLAAQRQRFRLRLGRLRPGGSGTVAAVQDAAGTVHTTAEGMADAIAAHWRVVFGANPLDRGAIRQWLAAVLPPAS